MARLAPLRFPALPEPIPPKLEISMLTTITGWRPARVGVLVCALAFPILAQSGTDSATPDATQNLDPAKLTAIRGYISSAWDTLTRSMTDCKTVVDPKLPEKSVLYLPAEFPTPPEVQKLQQDCKVQVKNLPKVLHGPGELDTSVFYPHGLLYLEHPYVVPGGRFNEMYGWDSYFIIRGLVQNGRIDLARGMVENFFFEIEHYGTFLNANRTYYLTRSQPPFLTSMIMAVYGAQKAAGKPDNAWLAKAYQYASKDYAMWMRDPHKAGLTGLSRYYDFGEGPAPESIQDESGEHRQAMSYLASHPEFAGKYVAERQEGEAGGQHDPSFTMEVCDAATTMAHPACEPQTTVHLTKEFFKGDRAMRESGFDVSFRFGPFGAGTHHFAPVCLNSLLYKTEKDLETMARLLGHTREAQDWREKAETRAGIMRRLFWDPEHGQFFDYDFEAGKRSDYEYVTTFYPLWAGWATPEQAKGVEQQLSVFELPGGAVMSRHQVHTQWDYPNGWAPMQLITVEGLRNYKFNPDADRLSRKFLSTVMENFHRDGTIREKYNMVTRTTDSQVTAGYQMNVIGFGWTNGVFLVLADALAKP
jgi:alpha,alpha-trehalase